MILRCVNCKPHPYQDKMYGKNMRVFNPRQKPGSRAIVGFRCTVCSSTIVAPKEVMKNSSREK